MCLAPNLDHSRGKCSTSLYWTSDLSCELMFRPYIYLILIPARPNFYRPPLQILLLLRVRDSDPLPNMIRITANNTLASVLMSKKCLFPPQFFEKRWMFTVCHMVILFLLHSHRPTWESLAVTVGLHWKYLLTFTAFFCFHTDWFTWCWLEVHGVGSTVHW